MRCAYSPSHPSDQRCEINNLLFLKIRNELFARTGKADYSALWQNPHNTSWLHPKWTNSSRQDYSSIKIYIKEERTIKIAAQTSTNPEIPFHYSGGRSCAHPRFRVWPRKCPITFVFFNTKRSVNGVPDYHCMLPKALSSLNLNLGPNAWILHESEQVKGSLWPRSEKSHSPL